MSSACSPTTCHCTSFLINAMDSIVLISTVGYQMFFNRASTEVSTPDSESHAFLSVILGEFSYHLEMVEITPCLSYETVFQPIRSDGHTTRRDKEENMASAANNEGFPGFSFGEFHRLASATMLIGILLPSFIAGETRWLHCLMFNICHQLVRFR